METAASPGGGSASPGLASTPRPPPEAPALGIRLQGRHLQRLGMLLPVITLGVTPSGCPRGGSGTPWEAVPSPALGGTAAPDPDAFCL